MKHSGVLLTVCVLAVTAFALAVRLPQLDERPMHCDEANQAMKTGLLLETGVYRYDPHEHHGPSLYWLTLPSLWMGSAENVAQTSQWQYRIVPVVFGAALILLLLLVSDGLGPAAVLVAAILMAVSPAMVFYSRYYIQETLLVFFSFAAVASGWRYLRGRRLGWAIATGIFVGLMHATKETWVLTAAAAVAGLGLATIWTRWRDGGQLRVRTPAQSAGDGSLSLPRPSLARRAGVPLLAGTVAACLVSAAFYSSFGTHWRGCVDSVLAYVTYVQRGGEAGIHSHPWYYYLQLLTYNRPMKGLFWTEGLIVGLALVGLTASLFRRGLPEKQRALCRFIGFFTLVLTILYSFIPYKTPWCMLGFLLGMILLAGVGARTLIRIVPTWPLKTIVTLLLLVGIAHLGRQSYLLNTRFRADQRNPYVYAHASTDMVNLAQQMERLAAVSPQGHEMAIHVVTPENYWPLPWYLRHFDRDSIGFWQDAATWRGHTRQLPPPSVIILTVDVQEAVDANLPAQYNKQMMYGLQPGVLLNVYAREDLWEAFLSANSAD